jgi:hypothetical protein
MAATEDRHFVAVSREIALKANNGIEDNLPLGVNNGKGGICVE